ncbi:cytochrome P450 [Hypoxylon sp. FL1284]|nr:cytochrome P450 [Hypoxylon sp. FL1284]
MSSINSSFFGDRVAEIYDTSTYNQYALWLPLCIGIYGLYRAFSHLSSSKSGTAIIPTYGYRSIFEPTLLLQSRFIFGALDIVQGGYKKFKDVPYRVRRFDVDFIILPMRYLSEVRLIPFAKLSGRGAQVGNLVPNWTRTQIMIDTNLHVRVLNQKLTPELSKYVDLAKKELDFGWQSDVPRADGWVEVHVENLMRMCVARMSARIFMGYPTCRDKRWLNLSINLSIETFKTAFTLRMFPPWTHHLIAHLVPARYRLLRHLRVAQDIVSKSMREYAESQEKGQDKDGDDPLLYWMMDNAMENEKPISEMSARQAILSLASIHTTSMNAANMLLDLCNNPECVEDLREEIAEVSNDVGELDELGEKKPDMIVRQWLPRLEKLDSFLVESQRMNPVILLNPQRVANQSFTFKDGTHIAAGTRLTFCNYAHQHDPAVTPNPEAFDPMRSYRKRHSAPEHMNKYISTQLGDTNLTFGYGNQACPGRYFAVAEIKMIMVRLLSEFEFKFFDGQSRPKSRYADENVYPDPDAKILMRRRRS